MQHGKKIEERIFTVLCLLHKVMNFILKIFSINGLLGL